MKVFKFKSLLFAGFLIAYGIIILYLAYQINLSEDETYTLNTTSRSLLGVIRQSYYFEGQPPVYFILLSLWRHLYPGIFFIKLFSIIMIGLSALALYKFAQLFPAVINSKWLVVVFLLNPFTIWAALEVRTYSLLILLSTISIYFFYRFYFEGKNKFLYWFLLIVSIGLYTQYFFTLLITALGAALLINKGWQYFFRFCIYLIPVVIFFLPNLIFMQNQIEMHEVIKEKSFASIAFLSIVHTPVNQIIPINFVQLNGWFNKIIRISFIILIIYASFGVIKKNPFFKNKYVDFFKINMLTIFFLIIFFWVTISATGIIYMDKYMSVCFPLFILIYSLFSSFGARKANFIYGSISIYFVMLSILTYHHPVKTYDFKSVAKYVEKIERPGEPILFYRSGISLPFRYYYTGRNPYIPLPNEVKYDGNWVVNIKDTTELKHSINVIETSSPSYLLISDLTHFESTVNMNRKMISDYLSQHYDITLDTLYVGWSNNMPLRIRRLQKKNKLPF